MRTYRSLGLAMFAAVAAGVAPAVAQDVGGAPLPDSTPLALVFAVYPDTAAAMTAMDKAQAGNASQVGSYAVVSKDKKGKVTVQETPKKKETTTQTTARAQNAVDGVVALLGEHHNYGKPSASQRAAQKKAGVSAANMDQMQEALTPGTSAIIAVVPQPDADNLGTELKQEDTTDPPDTIVIHVVPVQ